MQKVSFIIIGNEILSGRTQDANVNYFAKWIENIGLDLIEVRCILDDHNSIVRTIKDLKEYSDFIFTSGGIGPTHDDITADAVAAACHTKIDIRDDAKNILLEHYGKENLTDARLRMARIPEGAELIHNPISAAPGFIIDNIYVMAGIPKIQRAMLESLQVSFKGMGREIYNISVKTNSPESVLSNFMGQLEKDFKDLSVGSYPYQNDDGSFAVRVVLRSRNKKSISDA